MAESTPKAIWLNFIVFTSLLGKRVQQPGKDPLNPTPLAAEYIYVIKTSNSVTIKGYEAPHTTGTDLQGSVVVDISDDDAGDLYMLAKSDSSNYDSPVILYNMRALPGNKLLAENTQPLILKEQSTVVPSSFNPLTNNSAQRYFWFYHNKITGKGTTRYAIDIAVFDDDGNPYGYFEFQLELTKGEPQSH